MAIALLRAVYHSRKAGHSAVRGAAYRAGARLTDERTGEVCDWTHRRDDILFDTIITPEHAPAHLRADRAALWNAVEAAENRGDARVAYEIKLALPHELTHDQNFILATAYAQQLMERHGQAVDLVIHKPDDHGDTRNIHAHLMLSPRVLEADGFAKKKLRAITDKVQGPQEIESWRQGWQDLANAALERAGQAERIDMRSYARQGIEREGEIHLGPAASAMERRGIQTDKGDQNRDIKARNQARDEAKIIDLEIEREKRRAADAERAARQATEQARRSARAARYHQMIAREKAETTTRHEKEQGSITQAQEQERARLAEGQNARLRQQDRERAGRFRGGVLGWVDKLTGRHERTAAENAGQRQAQLAALDTEREAMSVRQEQARQDMRARQRQAVREDSTRHAGLERDAQEILRHGETLRMIQAVAQEMTRATERERTGERQRGDDGTGRTLHMASLKRPHGTFDKWMVTAGVAATPKWDTDTPAERGSRKKPWQNTRGRFGSDPPPSRRGRYTSTPRMVAKVKLKARRSMAPEAKADTGRVTRPRGRPSGPEPGF